MSRSNAIDAFIGLADAVKKFWQSRGSPNWPMVRGRIEGHAKDENGRSIALFSYSVNGDYYSGECSSFDIWDTEVGSVVMVRYSPQRPEIAIVEKVDWKNLQEDDLPEDSNAPL